jgi:hypothetical protein
MLMANWRFHRYRSIGVLQNTEFGVQTPSRTPVAVVFQATVATAPRASAVRPVGASRAMSSGTHRVAG